MQQMRLAGWLSLFLLLGVPAWAQYNTPTIDGNIGGGEYGNQSNGQNQQTTNNGVTTWFMTYDANYLYFAINGQISTSDASFVYLDVNPTTPVNGGSSSNGNLVGIGEENHNLSSLPFRADYAIYVTGGVPQLRRADGSGNWTTVSGAFSAGDFVVNNGASNSGAGREIRVAWTKLGSQPGSYNWLGYCSYQSNGPNLFGSVPTDNPYATNTNVNGNNGLAASYYYTVSTVVNGGTKPFSQRSYTFPGTSSFNSFGAISVYDFTVNTAGQQLSRGCGGGDWTIAGTLTVGAGSLYFGSNSGSSCGSYGTTSASNVNVLGGLLDLDYTYNPLTVSGNVSVNGGTLKLSNTIGGDLRLAGNLNLTGGTFNPTSRALIVTGTAQTLSGSAATPLAVPYLTLRQTGTSSTVTLGSNAAVTQQVQFGTGQLLTGSYTLDLGTTGALASESPTSNITGLASATRTVGAGGSGAIDFGSLGLTLTPAGNSAALGSVTVTRSRGLAPLTGQGSSQSIQRYFRLVSAGASAGSSYDVNMALQYFDTELGSVAESGIQFFSSADVTTGSGTFTKLGINSLDQTSNTAVRNDLTQLGQGSSSGLVFTLGDQANPLPVQLVSFAATRTSAGTVRLSWRTALELQNAGFGIERQLGAGEWQPVAFVAGQGTSQGHAYDYLDATAPAGALYYRLRQVDLDGTTSYSPVVAVLEASALGAPAVYLSPVPAPADLAALNVDLSTLPAAARTLAVYDLQGRLLLQATAPAEAATAALPVASLAAGTYLVVVRNGSDSYRTRFIKL